MKRPFSTLQKGLVIPSNDGIGFSCTCGGEEMVAQFLIGLSLLRLVLLNGFEVVIIPRCVGRSLGEETIDQRLLRLPLQIPGCEVKRTATTLTDCDEAGDQWRCCSVEDAHELLYLTSLLLTHLVLYSEPNTSAFTVIEDSIISQSRVHGLEDCVEPLVHPQAQHGGVIPIIDVTGSSLHTSHG